MVGVLVDKGDTEKETNGETQTLIPRFDFTCISLFFYFYKLIHSISFTVTLRNNNDMRILSE